MNVNAHSPHVHAARHRHAASAAAPTAASTAKGSKPAAAPPATGDTVQLSAAALQASDAQHEAANANQK